MTLTAIAALICIILGIVGTVIDEKILMATLEWFVLAIAFNTLGVGYSIGGRKA